MIKAVSSLEARPTLRRGNRNLGCFSCLPASPTSRRQRRKHRRPTRRVETEAPAPSGALSAFFSSKPLRPVVIADGGRTQSASLPRRSRRSLRSSVIDFLAAQARGAFRYRDIVPTSARSRGFSRRSRTWRQTLFHTRSGSRPRLKKSLRFQALRHVPSSMLERHH